MEKIEDYESTKKQNFVDENWESKWFFKIKII